MKRFTLISFLLCMVFMAMAQGKLTPGAKISIEQKKAAWQRKAARAKAEGAAVVPQQTIRLVVKVESDNAAETYRQIKETGAVVCSKIGQQVVIQIPVDKVQALEHIEGIVRIDKCHKGKKMTDIGREATGVSMLNGPTALPDMDYTGKGVTLLIFDAGFDFQHPAFKDAEGRSRIKCVYIIGDDGGRPFTINDPEVGEITLPGSIYDTPELIEQLTTDDDEEYHGSHTLGIAAGSLSPQGFGGMAPDADIVIVTYVENEQLEEEFEEGNDLLELVLGFAEAYAKQSEQPVVLSISAGSHDGPHDGTGTIPEALTDLSESLVPVLSVGNEGGYPLHIYRKFTAEEPSFNTLFMGMMPDESGEHEMAVEGNATGYSRNGGEVSVQVNIKKVGMFNRVSTVWSSQKFTATPGCDVMAYVAQSDEDEELAQYFDGIIAVGAFENDYGRLGFQVAVEGGIDDDYVFELSVSGAEGTEVDVWDNVYGFGGADYFKIKGEVDGDSELSCSDWTSSEGVISVGAYCTNNINRLYNGQTEDTSRGYMLVSKLDDYAAFSSYGTSFNGVQQPVVSAPGWNIVSSWNHYAIDEDETIAESMQWQGYPYGGETGTSMSCPCVAGIVALWKQCDPSLSVEDVKTVLSVSSVNDEYTALNTERWGYGKVNALNGIRYLLDPSGIKDLSQPKAEGEGQYYDLQGRRVNRPGHGIYILRSSENGKVCGRKIMVK